MTAMQHSYQPASSLKGLLLVGLAGLLALVGLASRELASPARRPASLNVDVPGADESFAYMLQVVDNVQVKDRDHAIKKHGKEAREIRKCLDNFGPREVWKFTSWRRLHHYIQTCKLDDGRWGLRIIQLTKSGWVERTAFIVKAGTKQELVEYVTARAERFLGSLADIVF